MAYTKVNFQDGTTPLNAATLGTLDQGVADADTVARAAIPTAQKAQANGVASLGADGKVPTAQLPALGGASLTYEGDWAAPTTYDDGDVVVKDGIVYLCVGGPTTTPPDPALWGAAALAGGALAYAEFTAPVTVPIVAEASAVTVVTAPAITLDGATPILVSFFAPQAQTPATTGAQLLVTLWDGSTDLGRIGQLASPAAATLTSSLSLQRRLTPSAGAHTFTIKAWMTAGGSGTIGADVGGTGLRVPGFIRIARG